MADISIKRSSQILVDPRFIRLTTARGRLRWGLSFVVLGMFFGLITLMSYAPAMLALPLGPSGTTVGIALAFAVFIGIVAVTGFYVYRSNTRFDRLTQAIKNGGAR